MNILSNRSKAISSSCLMIGRSQSSSANLIWGGSSHHFKDFSLGVEYSHRVDN